MLISGEPIVNHRKLDIGLATSSFLPKNTLVFLHFGDMHISFSFSSRTTLRSYLSANPGLSAYVGVGEATDARHAGVHHRGWVCLKIWDAQNLSKHMHMAILKLFWRGKLLYFE